ncbi:MAG: hypothetical protein ABI539_09470 [Acidobacteriota bacterium]
MTGPFNSELDAVRAGFRAIMADNNKQHYREFGFWVVMKKKPDNSGVTYCYTEIVDGGSGEVSQTLPQGMVRANCHTHPKRYSTGNFSTNDRNNFKMLREKGHPMAFFLLTPFGQISVAREDKDFPGGKNVPWS